ncbi:unnamed protein product [Allacma fusca]|uniref:Uncharacterized protein n=1 Tax=Allacma fusca TaxID=39272 RepID=A0A8J2PEX3_9HEXA|nr:unnamed protein product [Allacma fusca]
MKEKKVKDGESLQGTSVQTISNSTPLLQDVKTSCTIKLSNFLDSAVTDLQFVLWQASRNNGPSRVVGNFSEAFSFSGSRSYYGSISRSVGKSGRFSCNVEIVNCLSVPLRNKNKWYCNSNDKDSLPLEIQSFNRESFLGSSDTKFKAMFSYEILSTDLALSMENARLPKIFKC